MNAPGTDDTQSIPLQHAPDHDIDSDSSQDCKAVQVLQVELARDAVRDMQKAARAGRPITLGFGKHLYLRYGNFNKQLRTVPARFRQELYQLDTSETNGRQLLFRGLFSHSLAVDHSTNTPNPNDALAEAATARMKEQYAAINEEKKAHQTEFLNKVVDPNKARRVLPSSTPRSTPRPAASPAVSAQRPGQIPQSSASLTIQGGDATSEAHRFVLTHLLAMGPTSEAALHNKTGISHETLQALLGRYAERDGLGKSATWQLVGRRFKELDVWRFPYRDEDRELAVENAIRALDKIRLDPHDKIWQGLLPKEERNKGKLLSRAAIWEESHRKMLNNIEGNKTPQTSKQTEAGRSKELSSDTERPTKFTVKKESKAPAKSNSNSAALKTVQSSASSEASTKGKKDSKVLSNALIEDSDEEFEKAAANEAARPSEGTKPEAKPKAASPAATAPVRKLAVKHEPVRSMTRAAGPAASSVSAKKRKVSDDTAPARNPSSTTRDAPPKSVPSAISHDVPEAKRLKVSDNGKSASSKAAPVTSPPMKSTPAVPDPNGIKSASEATRPATSESVKRTVNAGSSASSTPSHKSKASVDSQKGALSNGTSNGIKSKAPISKTSSPIVNGTKIAKPNGEMLKSYNSLVKQYNDLSKDSPRRRSILNDIRSMRSKAQRTSDASTISHASGDSTPAEPLSRRQTLQAYGKYYRHFQSYCNWKAQLTASPSADDRKKDSDQFARLAELQKDVLIGFDSIVDAFLAKPRGRIARDDSKVLLKESECEMQCWKARAKFLEWRSKYEAMRNNAFGDMTPDDMGALWDELGSVQEMRDAVLRSVALGFGARREGRLEDVELERVFGA